MTHLLSPHQEAVLRYWPSSRAVMPDHYAPTILPVDQAKASLLELAALGLVTHTVHKRGWYRGRDVFTLTEAGLNRAANL